jgi:hypothetical protein
VDYQIAFNLAVGTTAFFGGWVLNKIATTMDRLDKDLRDLPHVYVTKADYREDVREIKEMLIKICDKIDHKADK